jgi:tRNA threonylcarbamoyladenosine biosynthesis protein TsaB
MSAATGPILALDSGSPRVSVAVGWRGEIVAERSAKVARSSTALLRLIDEALAAAGLRPADLAGVAALAGPGSFTGLRIGLATALGLAQALGIAATAVPTLAVLAAEAVDRMPGEVPGSSPPASRIVAAVDVLRGEWAVQVWEDGLGGPMEIVAEGDLARLAPATISGWGVGRLAALPGWPADAVLREPGPLAPAALGLLPADLSAWDAGRLTAPIYGRPPAVTKPRPRAAASAVAGGNR